jgi:hypothetical protein
VAAAATRVLPQLGQNGMTRDEIASIAKQIRAETQSALDLACKRVDEREAALRKDFEQRIAAIESFGVKYLGVWQSAADYVRGNMVTLDGSMWHANENTRDKPGTSKAWTLAVKSGAAR